MNTASSRGTTRTTTDALAGLARRTRAFPSPTDWQDEVIYQLLPDRFSDGQDASRPLLDRGDLASARPVSWDPSAWAESGHSRFQGGTLKGVTSRLDYLRELGVTTVWLGPPWKQRAERNDYHGYAIQDFLDVDPRFGRREDLVELVTEAHDRGLRVILDIVINHTGENWLYQTQLGNLTAAPPPYRDHIDGPYPFGAWLAGDGTPLPVGTLPNAPDDGVWPQGSLQSPDAYHRAGGGPRSYWDQDPQQRPSAFAEFRRADWYNRDLALTGGPLGDAVLQTIIECWTYWLQLTDCDGFRIDTFKHTRIAEGRRFCAAIREYAEAMGKDNLLLLAEVGGGDSLEEGYLTVQGRNLSAILEIGEARQKLRAVAGGQEPPNAFFGLWPREDPPPPSATSEGLPPDVGWSALPAAGSHRNLGDAFVYSLDDHDNLWMDQLRFATQHPELTVPAVALVLFTLGIPCLYYGTEQALALPAELLAQLPHVNDGANGGDRYIREAMFGPDHPRRSGRDGLPSAPDPLDPSLPGFGPFGTSGHHVFDTANPTFRRVADLLSVRAKQQALRRGRQYLREIRVDPTRGFGVPAAGGLCAWSRILGTTEVLCVANLDPGQARGADVTVDATLNAGSSAAFEVLVDTAAFGGAGGQPAAVGSQVAVSTTNEGRRYVTVSSLGPAEVRVLA